MIFFKDIEEYHSNKERKVLIAIDMFVDMLSNKKLNPVLIELFTRDRKLKFSLVVMTKYYFAVPTKHQTKFCTRFYYENSKQKRASTNRV